ncbi:MAG: hypothetical protein ACXU8O_07360 [Asticcacaulis sp.]
MKLVEDLGWPARALYLLFGALLMTAAVATAWHDWPLIVTGKQSWAGFVLMLVVAVPLSLLIMVWAGVGRHREWHIHDNHIHIHLISLTSWARVMQVDKHEIAAMTLESAAFEDRANHVAYWLCVRLRDGRTLVSPKTFDKTLADLARQKAAKFDDADQAQPPANGLFPETAESPLEH